MNEMILWGNFSANNEGNYLNWTSVKLNVSNMIEDTVTKDEIRQGNYIKDVKVSVKSLR